MFKNPQNYGWIIAFSVILVYGQTLTFQNVLDDYLVIVDNDIVEAGFDRIGEIWQTPMTWGVGYNDGLYRPIPLSTYAIEIGILGEHNPPISHAINVILYIILCLVLFQTLKKVFPSFSAELLF